MALRSFLNKIKTVCGKATSRIVGNNNMVIQNSVVITSPSFVPMKQFVDWYSTNGGQYIPFPRYAEIRTALLSKDYKVIQFYGLSGLGKSRLIYEVFKGEDNTNNFYCYNASDERVVNDILSSLPGKSANGIIVLDNCSPKIFTKICNLMLSSEYSFRVIGIHHDMDAPVRMAGVCEIVLQRADMADAVNSYIDEQMASFNDPTGYVSMQIKEISDGFPVVAKKAIDAYKRNGDATLISEDTLWRGMCGYQDLSKETQIALMSLALFAPLGYKDGFSSDYEWVKTTESITPLHNCTSFEKDDIFKQLIDNLTKRELIEQISCWILVRPLPMAVWLVGNWFKNCGHSRLIEAFEDIDSIPDKAMCLRMKAAICKRIQNMQENESAIKLFNKLMEAGGSFHDEKVVGSDFGSRLFLAISTVNPVAVTECLYAVLSKVSTTWLKENLVGDTRRNHVWCLERLVFPSETFSKAALLLARLANSENESWSNNATGLFSQMFHVALPGTTASLKQRLSVIEELNTWDAEYVPLVLKAIDNAFCYYNFHRGGGAERFGGKNLRDFEPTGADIMEYWNGCARILTELIKKYPSEVDHIAQLVVKHAREIGCRAGCVNLVATMAKQVIEVRGNEWPEMYKELLFIKKHVSKSSSANSLSAIEEILTLIEPKVFYKQLEVAHLQFHARNYSSFEERIAQSENFFRPYAEKFKMEKMYTDENVVSSLIDSKICELGYIKVLSKVLKHEQILCLFSTIGKCLETKDANYQSRFVELLFSNTADTDIQNTFCTLLNTNGKYLMYVNIRSDKENDHLDVLREITALIKEKQLDVELYLNHYLHRVPLYSSQQLYYICRYIRENFKEADNILLAFVVTQLHKRLVLGEPMKKLTFELLLNNEPKQCGSINPLEVTSFVKDVLDRSDERDFAVAYNKKLLKEITDYDSYRCNEGIYFSLLPKYADSILMDILRELSLTSSSFAEYGGRDLGSGQGFGAGPLFQCDMEVIKRYCLQEADGCLPYRLAYLAPVFGKEAKFSDFFYWLIDNLDQFKYRDEILKSFDCNLHSFASWGSIIPLYEKQKQCFEALLNYKNQKVRNWAEKNLTAITNQLRQEKNIESYRKLAY